MMWEWLHTAAVVSLLMTGTVAFADCADELGRLVGYTVLDSKQIERWRGPDRRGGDGFEGCEFDRIIIFTDGTALRCAGYGYQYAYLPRAVILAKRAEYQGRSLVLYKMLVGRDMYDMHPLP